MQDPLFEAFGVDAAAFWKEVGQLPALYEGQGVKVNPETIYLNHLLSCVRQGQFRGLTNARLRELGARLKFFPGIPEIFETTGALETLEAYKSLDLKVEHYIVSTGLTQLIRGSLVAPWIEAVWGCELLEATYVSTEKGLVLGSSSGEVSEVAAVVDNTTKTRALFEISKGVNHDPEISVNQLIAEEDRRVPLKNFVYIADGPSDVPAFSVVNKGGGKTLAVYRKDDTESFQQARRLQEDGRVDYFAEADYRTGSSASLWITSVLQDRADELLAEHRQVLRDGQRSLPRHLA